MTSDLSIAAIRTEACQSAYDGSGSNATHIESSILIAGNTVAAYQRGRRLGVDLEACR